MRKGKPLIDYMVLDALANDLESIVDIMRILNSPTELGWRDIHPEPFERQEVISALIRGVNAGHVSPCVYSTTDRALMDTKDNRIPQDEALDDVWFRLTSKGRIVLNTWEVPGAE